MSIARAVYADSDVVLMDDPLSALDAHVARDVFEECICRCLGNNITLMRATPDALCLNSVVTKNKKAKNVVKG